MRSVQLTPPVDLAFCLIGTIQHLKTTDDFMEFLNGVAGKHTCKREYMEFVYFASSDCLFQFSRLLLLVFVSDSLHPGGLLVTEHTHPFEAFNVGSTQSEVWTADLPDGRTMSIEYGSDQSEFDPVTQVCIINLLTLVLISTARNHHLPPHSSNSDISIF